MKYPVSIQKMRVSILRTKDTGISEISKNSSEDLALDAYGAMPCLYFYADARQASKKQSSPFV